MDLKVELKLHFKKFFFFFFKPSHERFLSILNTDNYFVIRHKHDWLVPLYFYFIVRVAAGNW